LCLCSNIRSAPSKLSERVNAGKRFIQILSDSFRFFRGRWGVSLTVAENRDLKLMFHMRMRYSVGAVFEWLFGFRYIQRAYFSWSLPQITLLKLCGLAILSTSSVKLASARDGLMLNNAVS
ncbi:unnamed protein product, partial [Ectocarpus sp. 12 AP-2014]